MRHVAVLHAFFNRARTLVRFRAWRVPNARIFSGPFLKKLFLKRNARLLNFGLSGTPRTQPATHDKKMDKITLHRVGDWIDVLSFILKAS